MERYRIQKEKLAQASRYLSEAGHDLWLIPTREGSDPALDLLTKVKTVGLGAFIICADGRTMALTSRIDVQDVEESGLFDSVITYATSFEDGLREIIRNLQPGSIALNYSTDDHLCDGLGQGLYNLVTKSLEDVFTGTYVSSEKILSRVRAVKSPEELACLRKAIELTTQIYDEAFGRIRVGMSEIEVGELFVSAMKDRNVVNGLSGDLTPPMVLKERISHRQPGEARLEPGDFLIIDYSVSWNGYCSDIARTGYVLKKGETAAPEGMQNTFNHAHEAISVAFSKVRPGAEGWEIDDAARRYLLENEMPDITHATGHQIGLNTHDGGTLLGPKWKRYGKAPYGKIEKGMVFTLEPTILRREGYSALVEENIVVTEKGAEYLSRRQDALYLIEGVR